MARAMTLVEVLVGSFLALLLLSLTVAFLIPSFRAQVRGTQQVEVQEQAVLALSQWGRDLQRSGCAGLSLRNLNPATGDAYPSGYSERLPVLASIVPIRTVLGDTSLDWSDRPVFYWYDREAGEVRRREWPNVAPALSVTLSSAAPVRLPAADLLGLEGSTTGSTRTLAREAVWCDLTHSFGDGRSGPPGPLLTLRLRLVRGSDVCRLTRQVLLRY